MAFKNIPVLMDQEDGGDSSGGGGDSGGGGGDFYGADPASNWEDWAYNAQPWRDSAAPIDYASRYLFTSPQENWLSRQDFATTWGAPEQGDPAQYSTRGDLRYPWDSDTMYPEFKPTTAPVEEGFLSSLAKALGGNGTISKLLGGDASGADWAKALIGGLGAYAGLQQPNNENDALRGALGAYGRSPYQMAGLTPAAFNVPQARPYQDTMTNSGMNIAFSPSQWQAFGPQGRANLMGAMSPEQIQAVANQFPDAAQRRAATTPQAPSRLGRIAYAQGGLAMASKHLAPSIGYVAGGSGGQDDAVNARLSDGEYVMDADVVSALGDGNNAAGAKKLDAMRANIRKHKRSTAPTAIPPKAKKPQSYFGS